MAGMGCGRGGGEVFVYRGFLLLFFLCMCVN